MPNWCHNKLTVKGSPDAVLEFVKAVRLDSYRRDDVQFEGQPLSFERLIPRPENVEDWYSWSVEHWGTKWDANFDAYGGFGAESADIGKSNEMMGLDIDGDHAVYRFDTAWSPPSSFVEHASAMFGDLTFELEYGEVGNGMAGRVIYAGGQEIEFTELEVTDVLDPAQMWF